MSTYSLKEHNKPTVFIWGDYREKNHIDRAKTDTAVLKRYDDLFDEIYSIIIHRRLNEGSIGLFKECFTNKSKILWETSGNWIMQLTHYFSQFEALAQRLSSHKSSTVRLHLIQSLWEHLPTQNTLNEILTKGLHDISKQVRFYSASRIEMLFRKENLSDLKSALALEQEVENKKLLQKTISIFENGYWVEDFSNEQVWLHFRSKRGNSAVCIEKSDLKAEKISQIIRNTD
jgi:hypothetical protein